MQGWMLPPGIVATGVDRYRYDDAECTPPRTPDDDPVVVDGEVTADGPSPGSTYAVALALPCASGYTAASICAAPGARTPPRTGRAPSTAPRPVPAASARRGTGRGSGAGDASRHGRYRVPHPLHLRGCARDTPCHGRCGRYSRYPSRSACRGHGRRLAEVPVVGGHRRDAGPPADRPGHPAGRGNRPGRHPQGVVAGPTAGG